MRMSFKYSLVLMVLSGCSYSENRPPVEIISSSDYEYLCGINAAVNQFGTDHSDLIVDMSNKKVLSYVSDSYDNAYADGYHKTLEIIILRNNKICPDFH